MDSFGDAFDDIPVPGAEGVMAENLPIDTEFTTLTPVQNDLLAGVVQECSIPVINETIPGDCVVLTNVPVLSIPEDQKEKEEETPSGNRILAGIQGFNLSSEPKTDMNYDYEALARNVRVKITEEPAANKLRFRYAVEGRGAGAVIGEHSTKDTRTFPAIRIEGYEGSVVVVVSCVEDACHPQYSGKYRAHPHNIVGRDTKRGVAVINANVTKSDPIVVFQHIGIQCVRRSDAKGSLDQREQIKVDPFNMKFIHKSGQFNLNKVRLAFQVFLQPPGSGAVIVPQVAVSRVVMDKKSHGELKIEDWSDNCASVEGGKKILLFTERVNKDDIAVEFSYTDTNGDIQYLQGNFNPNNVHKQHGIAFHTPAFPNVHITQKVKAQMYLHSKKEDTYSDPVPFYFEPKIFKQEAKPIIVAARSNNKRDRTTMKVDDTPQQESTGKIVLPPKGVKTTGGMVSEVKPEPLYDGLSATEFLNKASPEQMQVLMAMNPPNMDSKDFTNYKINKARTEKSQNSQEDTFGELLNGGNIEQMGDPANIDLGAFDSLSADLSKNMQISEKNTTRNQNSVPLETPDVSMEQSKSKTNVLNDLG